ncbi:hypothetical protein SH668x_001204 [Planctomicrobium sp. SH668]|uniref:hypothetical protein n=1 Tax=Planctomicrobium sp. SH668 TaxID=3448126 RepID=UPI003F5C2531
MNGQPTYGPLYASLYPDLAIICRNHGFALAVHGSLQRDFDLIAVPWVDLPSKPDDVIKEVTSTFALRQIGDATAKLHGRLCYTLSFTGSCYLDFSFIGIEEIAN